MRSELIGSRSYIDDNAEITFSGEESSYVQCISTIHIEWEFQIGLVVLFICDDIYQNNS